MNKVLVEIPNMIYHLRMAYEVRIIKQAQAFIAEMETKLRARVFWVIGLLEDMGPFLGEPYSKKIHDQKGLYELRIQSGNLGCRLFYFHSRESCTLWRADL